VGTGRLASLVFNILTLIVTSVTTLIVFLQLGLYAAIVWLPFPMGALSYIKGRFGSLETKNQNPL
jgi:ABC-type methionine transport system permease subunit